MDTLAYPGSFQTLMKKIWASSPRDVYVVGHNSGARGKMYHFDGNQWQPVHLSFGAFDLHYIHGFAADDIWAVGEHIWHNPDPPPTFSRSGLIIHYDGTQWSESYAWGDSTLQSVWGSSPTDIWAGGMNTLLHFDGTRWTHFPVFVPSQGIQITSISGLAPDDVYITGYRNDVVQPLDSTFYYLYHFDGTACSVVDSACITVGNIIPKFGSRLATVDGSLYSADGGVYKKEDGSWIRMFYSPGIIRVGGSSADNLFCVGLYGQIYHYNGQDWQRIIPQDGFEVPLCDIWTDGTEAFAIGYDGYKTYVLHGK